MRRAALLALTASLLASPAFATSTFVDFEFDRSAWEAAAGAFVEEPFDNDIPQADVLDFDGGIVSVASGANDSPAHYVGAGLFHGTLRVSNATSVPGYLSFVWTFPEPVTAFGADFYSIGGDRMVSVQGTFDGGLEAFDLRTLFIADGGLDQGFFGLTSSVPFTSITLVALGSNMSNDSFTVDNVVTNLPEPAHAGVAVPAVLAWLARRRRLGPARDRRGA